MFTPQEIQEKCFSKAFMGGYDMGEVDDFLDPLSEDYAALYKENALLKSKMKVLVEKIEEYRAAEDSMKQTISAAKAMASDIVEEAQQKADAAKTASTSGVEAAFAGGTVETAKASVPESSVTEEMILAEEKRYAELNAEISKQKKELARLHGEKTRYIEGMRRVLAAQEGIISGYEGGDETAADDEVASQDPPFAVSEEPESTEKMSVDAEAEQAEPETADDDVKVYDEMSDEEMLKRIAAEVNEIADEGEVATNMGEETRQAFFSGNGEEEMAEQIGMFDDDPTIVAAPVTDADVESLLAERKESGTSEENAEAEETETEEDAQPVKGKKRRFDFENLQFGKDYEIK